MVLTLTLFIGLTSCLKEYLSDVTTNDPETVESVIGVWKGKHFQKGITWIITFKEDMTVTITTDSEGMNWSMNYPWIFKWKTENNSVKLYGDENEDLMSGKLKDDDTMEILIIGSESTIMHQVSK